MPDAWFPAGSSAAWASEALYPAGIVWLLSRCFRCFWAVHAWWIGVSLDARERRELGFLAAICGFLPDAWSPVGSSAVWTSGRCCTLQVLFWSLSRCFHKCFGQRVRPSRPLRDVFTGPLPAGLLWLQYAGFCRWRWGIIRRGGQLVCLDLSASAGCTLTFCRSFSCPPPALLASGCRLWGNSSFRLSWLRGAICCFVAVPFVDFCGGRWALPGCLDASLFAYEIRCM